MLIDNENIFHNKVDFEYETRTTTKQFESGDRPYERESRSQKAQLKSGQRPERRNDMHTPMKDKQR